MKRHITAAVLLILLVCATPAFSAVIAASGDASMPSQTTSYPVGGNITEDVALAAVAGPWLKNITNTGSGIASGADRTIIEFLTNVGLVSWTGWHEQIVSRTTINSTDDSPGFLFHSGSLSLQADYGSGFVPLTQGTDYTLVTTPYSGPPFPGNNGEWEAITVLLSPTRTIAPGNALRIQKDIFEVFGDADPWKPGESAQISQYPLPEPTGLCASLFPAAAVLFARRKKGA